MKEMIEILARALVDEPELVSVNEVGGMHTSILALTVAKADIGKVVGKQGRTADALRTLLNAVSAKEKKRTLLEIVD
ncbi:MAG: KH domain-containing protein [Desulfatitalea sp.]|nr:KH domain-containing protein [Desulfatitalea sp.]NNK00286.1 KH domain-containing protein [Desulfatitalea sp.]